MTHPIQKILDRIWNEGHTPMILVDSRPEDVVLPAHIKDRYKESLALMLGAKDPLNIEFDETGIHADLAFNFHVARCTIPWKRNYQVMDTTTGAGVKLTLHEPSANEQKAAEEDVKAEVKRATFTVISGGKSN